MTSATGGRVFTASWGQLESGGSNLGDTAILAAQLRDLGSTGAEVGVLSAEPNRTRQLFPAARAISLAGGRVAGLARGVLWADTVVVGGGELAQDVSSLLYSPFNLLPLMLARLFGRQAFAWGIGVGQGDELRPWTRRLLRRWLGTCRGVTTRDEPTRRLLLSLGLSARRVVPAADSAFSLAGARPGADTSGETCLAAAPRNVLNRQGKLLPLELRRKLGLWSEPDATAVRQAWARLLDRHLENHGGEVLMLPFHTGTLSNSDDRECRAIIDLMSASGRVRIVDTTRLESAMDAISRCRVMVTVPLHGSILSVVQGVVPLAAPYATKGSRFMEQAGLQELLLPPVGTPGWTGLAWKRLQRVWTDGAGIRRRMMDNRRRLLRAGKLNLLHFRRTCGY